MKTNKYFEERKKMLSSLLHFSKTSPGLKWWHWIGLLYCSFSLSGANIKQECCSSKLVCNKTPPIFQTLSVSKTRIFPMSFTTPFFFFSFFVPSTSTWGVYSETFIHHYNITLAHSFTCLFFITYINPQGRQLCQKFVFFKPTCFSLIFSVFIYIYIYLCLT